MKTLILFVDAFSFSDLTKQRTPFMYKLAKNGAYGPLTTIPAGYHIEYSMLSGSLPLKHNVWTWYYMKKGSFSKIRYIKPLIKILQKLKREKLARLIMDVYLNFIRLMQGKTRFLKTNKIPIELLEKFEVCVDKMHVDHNALPVPTLFDTLRQEGKEYVAMERPVISNNKKTWFYFIKDDFKQIRKAEKLLQKYPIVYLHIWELDSIQHKYGLHSKEALNYLKKIDNVLRKISEREKVNIIVFSDHGGCDVTKTKNIVEILKKYNVEYFIGSTTAQIWFKKHDEKQINELKKQLKQKGYLVYDETNIAKELKIPYKREFVGDILAYVKPHEQLYPDFFRDTAKVKSMHGYTKKVPELDGTFILNGFNTKKKIRGMKLYDIAPTILKAMKMKIPKIWDGKAKV